MTLSTTAPMCSSTEDRARGLWPLLCGLGPVASGLSGPGAPEERVQRCTLAQELSHPFSLARALIFAAMLHQLRRERPLTQERAEAAIALASEQGFPAWLGQGTILQGWALAEQGQSEEGIAQIRQGLATCQAIGAGLFRSYYLALLAEAYGKAGQAEEGLAALAEALTVVDKSGERFYEAELYRLKGELLLPQEGSRLQAEGYREKTEEAARSPMLSPKRVSKAIEIAQKQQAKSLELRAVMSLARLWQQQGKTAEAHQMLSEIYNWFTEGFDTKDLQEAKALLEELSH